MSTAQGPGRRPRPVEVVAAAAGRLATSYLVQFLLFVAVLVAVVVLLARQPEGCACVAPKVQIVLLALGGTLAIVGSGLRLAAVQREAGGSGTDSPGAGVATALVGAGVALVAAAGLVGFW